jgi:hypothetical protein
MRGLLRLAGLLGTLCFAGTTSAAEISGPGAKEHRLLPWARIGEPDLAEASPEAETNLQRITVPKGFKLELWAAEPMLANPVALCLDEKGRVFVAETHRYRTSVLDIRHYMFMLEEDLACRTVEDRIEMCARNFPADFSELSIETEVVRLLEDRDGDGRADFSAVYADKFDSVLDGIASGLLARKGKVYFTNIRMRARFTVAIWTAANWRSCIAGCAIRRSWPSMITAIFSPGTMTSITATRSVSCTWSRAATAAGGSATSTRRSASTGSLG